MGRWLAIAAIGVLCACRSDMQDQPKYKPLGEGPFFQNDMASRPLVEGTVVHGAHESDESYRTGGRGTQWAANPLPRTMATFDRGRERYEIFCTPCHDRVGTGRGMIVERGFKEPPTFHQDRLRTVADGYFVRVMTEGFGVMPSYAEQVPAEDRWAIVAWIRVLQRSQDASVADVPAAERATLDAAPSGRPTP